MLKVFPKYFFSTLWGVIIVLLCWLPKATVAGPKWLHIPHTDKIVHFALFFVWSFFLYRDLSSSVKNTSTIFYTFILAISLASLTEILQPIISDRDADLLDGICDLLGACVGLLLWENQIWKRL